VTYRVVILLRAETREQVKAAIEAAFGSITAEAARISARDDQQKDNREGG